MWATTAITITTPAPTATATPIHYFVGTPERLNHSLQNCTPKSFQLMWFVVSKCFQWRPYCWTTHPPLAGTESAHCSYARAMRGPSTFGGAQPEKKNDPSHWTTTIKDHEQYCRLLTITFLIVFQICDDAATNLRWLPRQERRQQHTTQHPRHCLRDVV